MRPIGGLAGSDPALRTVLADLKDRMWTWYQHTADAVPFEVDKRW